jgi:CO/xanthine dehydrogenase Mo-binding subunit
MIPGERLRRPEAVEKVAGRAAFLQDSDFVGRLVAGCLRSPHAHARINRLDLSLAQEVRGVRAVLKASDIPGRNLIPMIQTDWPPLAAEYVRHVGEALALVAADNLEALEEALRAISVEYEPLPATLDMEAALESGEVVAQFRVKRGEAAVALDQSDLVVVEGIYRTPRQDHAYLEPHGVVAFPDGSGGVSIVGSLESPFAVQRAAASVLGWTLNRIRVAQSLTGGAFGGKEETPAMLGAQAALLAVATGRPVRMVLSREEDMTITSKRHPARIRCRTGATRDGHLVAAEVDCLLDGGAYATLSPLVLQRAVTHAFGPYRIPNVQVSAKVVRTHTVPCGAFRGSGEAQVTFASEGQIDLLAERLGIDALELRRRNALVPGDLTTTGRRLVATAGLRDVLDRVAESSDWARKRALFGQDEGTIRRGIGVAASHSGTGLGYAGRAGGLVCASLSVLPDGSVMVSVGRGDAGEGLVGLLSQIAAEALRCPLEAVRVLEPDTSRVSDLAGWGTPVSLFSDAIRDAAKGIRTAMDAATADAGFAWREAVEACVRRHVPLAAYGFAAPPEGAEFSEEAEDDASVTFSANVVELEVDSETGETRVLRVHSAHDAGRVLDTLSAEGQVEGAVVQGLGYALLEAQVMDLGSIVNNNFTDYRLPTSLDAPEIRSLLVEQLDLSGPDLVKGLGEAALVPVAPAVAAAIHNAVGVRVQELPAFPERIRKALRGRGRR